MYIYFIYNTCIQFILQQHDKRLKIKIQNNLLDRFVLPPVLYYPGTY
jgi:hypothetical protein